MKRLIIIPLIGLLALFLIKHNAFTASYVVSGSGSDEVDGVYVEWQLCDHRNSDPIDPPDGWAPDPGLGPTVPVMSYMKPGTPYRIGYRGCEWRAAQWIIISDGGGIGCDLFRDRGPAPYYARNPGPSGDPGYVENFPYTDTPPETGWNPKEYFCLGLEDPITELCPNPTVTRYEKKLTATVVGWGNVTPDDPGDAGYYTPGTDVELTASPDANWAFTGWSGDLSGSTNPETINMDANKNVTATFEGLKACDLFLNIVGSGTVTPVPDGGTYDAGTVVTLTAEGEDANWAFSEWSGDLTGRANPAIITMNADMNITATFSDDADGDGISNGDEDAGPNGGDANNDGTPDRDQPEIAVTKTYDNKYYVWLEVENPPGATLVGCQTLAPPIGGCGTWVEFPYGFFEFTIEGVGPGGAAAVSLHLPAGGVQDTYYKVGPRPGFPNEECYNFMFEPPTQTGAEINGDVITLHFVDGQRGDDDLAANGTIVDQGGPGVMFAEETLIGPTGGGSGTTGGGTSSAIGGCFVETTWR